MTCFALHCDAAPTGTSVHGKPACDLHLTGGRRFVPSPRLAKALAMHARTTTPFPPVTLVAGGVLVDGVFLRTATA